MRILGDGQVTNIRERVVDGDHILDADAQAEVDLQGGAAFAVEIRLLLEIADARAQGHNLLVGKLHPEMRIHTHHLGAYQVVALAVEGAVKAQRKGGIEPLAEIHLLGAAENQGRHSEFQAVAGQLVARSLKCLRHLVGEAVRPGIERGGAVAKECTRLPTLAVILQTEVQSKTPRVRELADVAVDNLGIGTQSQPLHLLKCVGIAHQESVVGGREIGDSVIVKVPLRINQLGGVHYIIYTETDIGERHGGAVVDLVADAGIVVFGDAREVLGVHQGKLVALVHTGQTGGVPIGGGHIVGDGAHRVGHREPACADAQRQELVAVFGLRPSSEGETKQQTKRDNFLHQLHLYGLDRAFNGKKTILLSFFVIFLDHVALMVAGVEVIAQEAALQRAVEEGVLGTGLQPYPLEGLSVGADEEGTAASIVVLEGVANFGIEAGKVVHLKSFAVGRVHHHQGGRAHRTRLTHIAPLDVDEVAQTGLGHVVARHLYEFRVDVTAIEPSEEMLSNAWKDNEYNQIVGDVNALSMFEDETFDIIICHNVLEYIDDKETVVKALTRVLKKKGVLSIAKHNRAGRVMQMAVLLDDFEKANALLDGENSMASKFGAIRYYEDEDIIKWMPELSVSEVFGIRTFWDLQQNQEKHGCEDWQDNMMRLEMRVAQIPAYKEIAFFHHLLLKKD